MNKHDIYYDGMKDYYVVQKYKGGEIRRLDSGKYIFCKGNHRSEAFDDFSELQHAIDNGKMKRNTTPVSTIAKPGRETAVNNKKAAT